MRTLLLLAATMTSLDAQSQNRNWLKPSTAREAYDYAQDERQAAGKLWSAGDPQGIARLHDLLAYLDQPLVRDLAQGSPTLGARPLNIYLDLAAAHAQRNEPERAIEYLRKVAATSSDPRISALLANGKAYASLKREPGFEEVLQSLRRYERFWDSKELATPYRHALPDAEKIAGLSKFWSEVKYNFGYPEKLVELQWDSLYLEWIPKVLAARTTADYYAQLTLLCARIGDGHTNVYPPKELETSKPPLRTQLVEGRVLITEVMSPALAQRGLRRGAEIVKIDGVPVLEYARALAATQSSSTPQDRQLRTFTYALLRGARNQPVRLLLRSPDGGEQAHTLERSGYTDATPTPPFAWRMLPGNIAYVSLTTFENNEPAAAFAEALPQYSKAAGLILDLRWNGGGSTGIGYAILSRLLTKPTLTARQVMRRYNPTERARGALLDWLDEPAGELAPRTDPHYHGPAVVLTSAATFSAAEDFLVAWRNAARGPIVGEASGGSTGQPLIFQLPGGGVARVCTKRNTFPDGREWVGIGIQPDVAVQPTARDVIAGRDTVLEHAANLLRNRQ